MPAPRLINRYATVMIDSAAARAGYDDYAAIHRSIGLQADPARSYSAQNLAYISRHVKLLMEDEFCGLTNSGCRVGAFTLMCELTLSGATLGDALNKAFHFYSILSDDLRFSLTTQRDLASIEVQLAHPEMDRENFLYEWWLLVWRGISCWLIGEAIDPAAVEFPHRAAAPQEEYADVFAVPCLFSQPGARVRFERRYLDKPVIRSIDDLDSFLSPDTLDLDFLSGVKCTLKARIKAQLKHRFYEAQSFPAMERIAEQYHMCSQTLRRRLEEEGSSYRQVKEEVRREVVMKWLSNLTMPIGEVSRMGGFAESNGLTRAVKSWIGMCPTEYRASLIRRQH